MIRRRGEGAARLVHRAPHLLRRRRRADLPAPLAAHRAGGRRCAAAQVRRSKLYYLRALAGKAARLKEKRASVWCRPPPPPSQSSRRSTRRAAVPSAPYRYEAQAWRTGVTLSPASTRPGAGPGRARGRRAPSSSRPTAASAGVADIEAPARPSGARRCSSVIQERAVAVGVGIVDHVTIDRINILRGHPAGHGAGARARSP